MPRIRCHYLDCVFLDDRFCSAAAIEIDPDSGCITYSATTGIESEVDDWEDEKELEEWEQLSVDEEDEEEIWLDEDDEY